MSKIFSKTCTDYPNYQSSTQRLRYLTKRKCIESGDVTKNFSDNNQHDAGEFLSSILSYMFKDSVTHENFDEQLFGGLWQNILTCKCGHINELPLEKMPEIIPLEIYGETIQHCLDHYFMSENVERSCTNCPSKIAEKITAVISEPATLIIQLNRYEYDREKERIMKKHSIIICPKNLTTPNGSKYSLSSFINHLGSTPQKGHYNLVLYNKCEDTFVLLDDTKITLNYDPDPFMMETQYLLTYVKNMK